MLITVKEICAWLNKPYNGHDAKCYGVSIDSRTILPGVLFVAIIGDNFDGHDFVHQAEKQGASAILVSRPVESHLPTILVEDTRHALGQLAKAWRKQWTLPVIAVTGSCGKTTTKTMLAKILQPISRTIATEGTLNNEIGLPLTVLKLTGRYQAAIFELGTSHPGEIATIAGIAQPTLSIITNAGDAHLEGFGSVDGVAKEKADIYRYLDPQGIAILNRDDPHADFWQKVIGKRRTLTFSMIQKADIFARDIRLDEQGCAQFCLVIPCGEIWIHLPLLGRHNVANALAAAATCFALYTYQNQTAYANFDPKRLLDDIKQGLESLPPIHKRLVVHRGFNGAKIIDDSYNANPSSLSAALELLAQYAGKKCLVLGDMAELGQGAHAAHQAVGRQARQLGIDALYAIGPLSCAAVDAFGEQGYHFMDKLTLIAALSTQLNEHVTVLIKGSRSAKMEDVLIGLVDTP